MTEIERMIFATTFATVLQQGRKDATGICIEAAQWEASQGAITAVTRGAMAVQRFRGALQDLTEEYENSHPVLVLYREARGLPGGGSDAA